MSLNKKFATLPKRVIEVPGVGKITMGNGNMGSLRLATEASEDKPKGQMPTAFANQLVHQMIIEPRYSLKEIEDLAEDQFEPMARCAAELQGMSNLQHHLDATQSPRKALNSAAIEQQRELTESLAKLAEKQKDLSRIFNNPLDSTLSSVMESRIPDLFPSKILDSIQSGVLDQANAFSEMAEKLQSEPGAQVNSLATINSAIRGLGDAQFLPESNAFGHLPASTVTKYQDSLASLAGAANDLFIADPFISTPLSRVAVDGFSAQAEEFIRTVSELQLPSEWISTGLQLTGIDTPELYSSGYHVPNVTEIETPEDIERSEEQYRDRRREESQDVLFKMERVLRDLVTAELSSVAGPAWWGKCVSQTVRNKCDQRKAKRERNRGLGHHPIHYSTIGELSDIIKERTNWERAFIKRFHDKIIFDAMMRFATVVRNDVDHARYSTNTEYTEFFFAAKWIHRKLESEEPIDPIEAM